MGLAHFDSKTIQSNWAKRSQVGPGSSWARPILSRSQIGPRSQDGSEHIQRQMMVTHTFYFMLCQSSLLSAVISFVYKDKWWFDEACQLFSVWKIFEKEFFYSLSTLN